VEDVINEMDGYFFVTKGLRCTACGEEYLDEKEGEKMIQTAKKLGVWGEPLKLHRKLSRSGRGTMLRIPTDIEQNLGLKGNEEVSISKLGNNRILIEINGKNQATVK
ncbi:MAG TPA: hypothetical protein VJG90_01800, partial [Candidatus Nanoarchaeia archaeon]|nr:hypothetical protein [Candidatus Nanoarchaeia archaeon]